VSSWSLFVCSKIEKDLQHIPTHLSKLVWFFASFFFFFLQARREEEK